MNTKEIGNETILEFLGLGLSTAVSSIRVWSVGVVSTACHNLNPSSQLRKGFQAVIGKWESEN